MDKQPMRHVIVNGLLFQLCWVLAIFSEPMYALLTLVVLIAHYVMSSVDLLTDLQVPTLVLITGVTIDSLFTLAGVYSFTAREGAMAAITLPVWLVILWVAFALTLTRSLAWMVRKGMWFIVACAVAGPLSYLTGRSAGAIYFDNPALTLIAIEWAAVGFCTYMISRYRSTVESKSWVSSV